MIMKLTKHYIFFFILLFYQTGFLYSQELLLSSKNLLDKLTNQSEIKLNGIRLELQIRQPIDHNNPDAGYFEQMVYLLHKDFNKPVVLVTEGYAARPNATNELTKLLDANQIIVEHRYFGKSLLDSLDYQFLNIRQAASDHHHITTLFKQLYMGKWIATGISKGGQTGCSESEISF